MSLNPFTADAAIPARISERKAAVGADLIAEVTGLLDAARDSLANNMGGVIAADDVARMVAHFQLSGAEELMLLALDAARTLARPPISNFFVGAVGLERQTGNLICGGNLEFPATHLGTTVHGEGFVMTRAASRGTDIAVLAIGEAHPCAHCRQYLSEFAATAEMVLIDPLGHRLTMAELYPWPFDPDYLGEPGYRPETRNEGLSLATIGLSTALADRLLAAGRAAHAPYSKCPGAVVLQLADGNLISGFSIESVAFNPSMPPLQAALIDLFAHGYELRDVVEVTLATRRGGNVDYAATTSELLARAAPGLALNTVEWA